MIKEIYKKYREDIGLWEQKLKLLFIPFYKYLVWKRGKTIVKYRLFKIGGAKYFEFRGQPGITISKERFMKEFNGNKYTVPVNWKVED